MSLSLVTFIAVGTVLVTVSFLTFFLNHKKIGILPETIWRRHGKPLNKAIYRLILILIVPIGVTALSVQNKELNQLILPALVISLASLFTVLREKK